MSKCKTCDVPHILAEYEEALKEIKILEAKLEINMKKKEILNWAETHSVSVEIASSIEVHIMKKNDWDSTNTIHDMGKLWYNPSIVDKERILQRAFRSTKKNELMWGGPIRREDVLK